MKSLSSIFAQFCRISSGDKILNWIPIILDGFSSIYNQYKVGINGFDISSIQFSLHYFFKDKDTIHQLMRNVCECTRLGGYFIGTCYDGKEVFNKLE